MNALKALALVRLCVRLHLRITFFLRTSQHKSSFHALISLMRVSLTRKAVWMVYVGGSDQASAHLGSKLLVVLSPNVVLLGMAVPALPGFGVHSADPVWFEIFLGSSASGALEHQRSPTGYDIL